MVGGKIYRLLENVFCSPWFDLIISLCKYPLSHQKLFWWPFFGKKTLHTWGSNIFIYIYIYILYIYIYIYIIYTLYIIYIIYIIYQIYILYICIDIYVKKTNFNVCDHCDHQKTYIFLYRYISELYSFVSVCACEGLNVLKS